MEELKYDFEKQCLIINAFAFQVKPKIEGFWYDEENYFILSSLIPQIYLSKLFISNLIDKYPETLNSPMSVLMFLVPDLIDFYSTETYPKQKVKQDIYKIISELIYL